MSRSRGAHILLFAAFVFAAFVTVGCGLSAAAAEDRAAGHHDVKAAAQKAVAASARLVAQSKEVYKTGEAPRQSDPANLALLDAVFDVGIIRKSELTRGDGDDLAAWLQADLKVGTIYITAGTGVADIRKMTDLKVRERSDQNVAAYALEMGRFLDSEIVLEVALLGTVLEDPDDPDDATLRDVKGQMRATLTRSFAVALKAIAIAGPSYEWRLDRLTTLDASIPRINKLLDSTHCRQLRETATQVSTRLKDSRVQDKLDAFGKRLNCS